MKVAAATATHDTTARVANCCLVGLVVDSVLFLQLAFGSLDFLPGQVLGKTWMVLLSLPLVAWLRRSDARRTTRGGSSSSPRFPSSAAVESARRC